MSLHTHQHPQFCKGEQVVSTGERSLFRGYYKEDYRSKVWFLAIHSGIVYVCGCVYT